MAAALMGMLLGANAGAVDLTAKNFDKEVLESGKSAFVKFLAPWCVRRLPCAFSIVFPRRSARIPRVLCSFATSSRRDAARDARAHPRELVRRPPEHYGTRDRTPRGLRGTNIPMRSEPRKHRFERRREFSFSTQPPAAESLTSPPSTLSSPTTGEATASR